MSCLSVHLPGTSTQLTWWSMHWARTAHQLAMCSSQAAKSSHPHQTWSCQCQSLAVGPAGAFPTKQQPQHWWSQWCQLCLHSTSGSTEWCLICPEKSEHTYDTYVIYWTSYWQTKPTYYMKVLAMQYLQDLFVYHRTKKIEVLLKINMSQAANTKNHTSASRKVSGMLLGTWNSSLP